MPGDMFYRLFGFFLNGLARLAPKQAGKLAFYLFCRPKRRGINGEERAFLKAGRFKKMDVNGQVIHLYGWGSGPKKVLFLHGWQSNSARWQPYVDALEGSGFRVLAYDAPGHGLSGGNRFTIPENAELIQRITNAVGGVDAVVGHSLGGYSYLYARSIHALPAVKRLVILASPVTIGALVEVFSKALGLYPKTVACMMEEMEVRTPGGLQLFGLSKLAGTLCLPGLIIHDQQDERIPFCHAEQLAAVYPEAKLIATRGLGHRLRSDEVVQLVAGFVRGSANEGN